MPHDIYDNRCLVQFNIYTYSPLQVITRLAEKSVANQRYVILTVTTAVLLTVCEILSCKHHKQHLISIIFTHCIVIVNA